MTKISRAMPSLEQRDHLLNVVYGNDPTAPPCPLPGHGDPKARRGECDPCRQVYLWRARMYRRFHARGLRLTFDDREYHDPEPPRCPKWHAFTPANCKICADCRDRSNWLQRRRQRSVNAGIERRFTDLDTLLTHLRRLRDTGMTYDDIARAGGCAPKQVRDLLTEASTRHWVSPRVAQGLLKVPVPERRLQLVPDRQGRFRRRVDSTGTRRRIQAACRAGHSIAEQAARLGWAEKTISGWLAGDTVLLDAADDVAALFPTLISRPGGNRHAAALAANRGWAPARYFTATNIDDPSYDPFAVIGSPIGLRRRLRSLAWMGQGPEQVAAFIGEEAELVAIWLKGGPALGYAEHLVDVAFEALSGSFGPDDQAAQLAREQQWAPPLAWHGIDMDDMRTRPSLHLTRGARVTHYPLQSQVFQALMGLIPADDLLTEETVRAVWILHRNGWSDRRIAAWLRWHDDLDKGRGAVTAFRIRHGIVGFGMQDSRSNHQSEDGLIVVPSAA